MSSRGLSGKAHRQHGGGFARFLCIFLCSCLTAKRKEGRRKPDGTAYQPKIECSAPEKPLQQMTGVGQGNMIFFRFKPTSLFLSFFFPPFSFLWDAILQRRLREKKGKWERIQGASYKRGQIVSCS